MSDWIPVCPEGFIEEGRSEVVDIDDVEIAVFFCEGQYYAVENLCSHDDEELAYGEVKDCEIVCPRHGAHFCLKTGEALTLPATEDIPVFPVRIEDGMVHVRDDRED